MKYLPTMVALFLTAVFSTGLVHANSEVELKKKNLVDMHTKEICRVSEGVRKKCNVWICQDEASNKQSESCILHQQYVCDADVDCHDGHGVYLDKANIANFFSGEYLYELVSYCWGADDCTDVLAVCIDVGGDFVSGLESPDSGNQVSGYCYIGSNGTDGIEIPGYEKGKAASGLWLGGYGTKGEGSDPSAPSEEKHRVDSKPDPSPAVGCDWDPASGICSWKVECSVGGGDECGSGTSGDDFCDCHAICGETPAPCAGGARGRHSIFQSRNEPEERGY